MNLFGRHDDYRPRPRGRLVAVTLLVIVGAIAWSLLPNFHIVIPGEVFRSSQPSAEQLRQYKDEYHLRTVVNLRGPWKGKSWYDHEHAAAEELDLKIVDINFINHQLPPLEELRHLIQVLDDAPKPILLHCRSGADRTGLASAIARVLAGEPIDQAREEFSIWYGHTGLAHGSHLPNIFDLYQKWLDAGHRTHSVSTFRTWVSTLDTLYYFSASIQPIDVAYRVHALEPWEFRIRVTNTSQVDWPADKQPMHLTIWYTNLETDRETKFTVPFPSRDIPFGQSIDVTVPMPAVDEPGRYRVEADVCDGEGIKFRVMGPFSWKREIEVSSPVHVAGKKDP